MLDSQIFLQQNSAAVLAVDSENNDLTRLVLLVRIHFAAPTS